MFISDRTPITEKLAIANGFNHFFTSIGPKLAEKITPPTDINFKKYLQGKHGAAFVFKPNTTDEVEKIISQIKSKNSCGHDQISTKLLKHLTPVLLHSITLILNQSLSTGIFPDRLKIARVIPLYKGDDDSLFNNYRPISLLPAISKVFEKSMFIQIYNYFQSNKLFYNSQFGFREGHSTEFAALELTEQLIHNLEINNLPLSIFVDLSKAFDTLDHNILIYKLQHYGISGKSSDLIYNYLHNRTQFVDLDGTVSDSLPLCTGVPQGSILGPLLFIIYVNDLHNANNTLSATMYADDTTLSTTLQFNHQSIHNPLVINNALNDFSNWLQLNKLSLNVKKTKYMIFHHPNKQFREPDLILNNDKIERVKTFTFLGLIMDEHLTWKPHIDKIASKLSRASGIINKLKNILPLNIKITLYNTLVLPHINFNILLWGHSYCKVYKLQKRIVRNIKCASYSSHTNPIFHDLNILKVQDIHLLSKLKFYYKHIKGTLPDAFQAITFPRAADTHDHNTRIHHTLTLPYYKHTFSKLSINYAIPSAVNSLDPAISDKFCTHSFKGFCVYTKQFIIKKYETICQIVNCYSCNRESNNLTT